MLINKNAGSWFFLGELFTNIPLPIDEPTTANCGSCSACIEACPTDAFVGPNLLDATRCISYLTIESRGAIPEKFRNAIGYENTKGSPIRRIGYDCWKRNIAIALGNADTSIEIIRVLKSELEKTSPMVREHIEWALIQHRAA